MKSFTVVAATVLSFCATVLARPMDVYAPPITSPTYDTIWTAGNQYNVTWDNSNPPKQITNTIGKVLLRVNGAIWTNTTLAQGFNITDGTVQVTAPTVPAGKNYSVVLYGDSGNWSPTFTIVTAGNSNDNGLTL